MNSTEQYVIECIKNNKKVSGKKRGIGTVDYAKMFLIAHNMPQPTCKECGASAPFKSISQGFNLYCSRECSNKAVGKRNIVLNKKRSRDAAASLDSKYKINVDLATQYYLDTPSATVAEISKLFSIPKNRIRNHLTKNYPDIISKRRVNINEIRNKIRFGPIVNDLKILRQENPKWSSKTLANAAGCCPNFVCDTFRKNGNPLRGNSSSYEDIVEVFLKTENISFIKNDRQTISPLELDFFIPAHRIAIEINGSYYHKDRKDYHLKKSQMCENKGIRLIHIFDFEINEKIDHIKSIIRSAVNNNKTIGARKCTIVKIDSKSFNKFCGDNHIQGAVNSSIRYGLSYNNNLMAVMGFSKPRFDKHADFELTRYCCRIGYNIIGGPTKLFKRFLVDNGEPSAVSYCQIKLFSGVMYEKLGFEFHHNSPPNYFWTNTQTKLSRYQTQKHKLQTTSTESQHMTQLGYFKVYDCGQKVFYYNINKRK